MAPRTNGKVRYTSTFYILRPVNLANGQQGEVRVAPIDDVVVIVAARDRAAHRQQQYLGSGYMAFQACRASSSFAK